MRSELPRTSGFHSRVPLLRSIPGLLTMLHFACEDLPPTFSEAIPLETDPGHNDIRSKRAWRPMVEWRPCRGKKHPHPVTIVQCCEVPRRPCPEPKDRQYPATRYSHCARRHSGSSGFQNHISHHHAPVNPFFSPEAANPARSNDGS